MPTIALLCRCYVGKAKEQWRPCSDQYYPLTNGPPQSWPVTYIHHAGPPGLPPTETPHTPSASPPFSTPPTFNGPPPVHQPDNGQNNVTRSEIQHQQSLVDQFLSIFSSSSSSPLSVPTNAPPEVSPDKPTASQTTAASTNYNYNVDAEPGFRVVDVTDKPPTTNSKIGSIVRLYSHSAINNRFGDGYKRKLTYVYI